MSTAAESDPETDEVVFLSPPEEFTPRQTSDQGGSPTLPRRSNRKRKSVSVVQPDMSKGSGSSSKKKKPSPSVKAGQESDKSMPKVPRTPQGAQTPKSPVKSTAEKSKDKDKEANMNTDETNRGASSQHGLDIGAMLRGMEERLAGKIEATNRAASEAVAMTRALEEKVNAGVDALRKAIEETEERLMMKVSQRIESMVKHQLHEAGFDPSLTVGGLSTVNATSYTGTSYAAATSRIVTDTADATMKTAAGSNPNAGRTSDIGRTERREDKFWLCRRSLRLWPVRGATSDGLRDFLESKLGLNGTLVEDAINGAVITKIKDPRSKLEEEAVVSFDSKEVRDAVKAQGHNLAKYKDEAGMRLHVPNYLQKDFKILTRLAYLMKKTNPDLKRNVKFDEDSCGLFLDMQVKPDARWRRVRPDEARKAVADKGASGGPSEMEADELRSMIGESDNE